MFLSKDSMSELSAIVQIEMLQYVHLMTAIAIANLAFENVDYVRLIHVEFSRQWVLEESMCKEKLSIRGIFR